MSLRLIIDSVPASGTWNMSVDEALLEGVRRGGGPVLRWYAWERPTISLGYFQPPPLDEEGPLQHLPRVRRLSGGGAILHHHEWTYSCVLPAAHPLAGRPTDLYLEVHRALIEVLHEAGVDARLRGERTSRQDRTTFLCFLRGDPRDIVLHGRKIVGSAQRRREGAVLQHGSVLLRASEHSPEQPGLYDLSAIEIDELSLRDRWALAVARVLCLSSLSDGWPISNVVQSQLSVWELAAAKSFERERYTRLDWKAN